MYLCLALVIFFAGKCILADESTHMPVTKDQELTSEVQEALKREVVSESCRSAIIPKLTFALKNFKNPENGIPISPCAKCNFDTQTVKSIDLPTGSVRVTFLRPPANEDDEDAIALTLTHVFLTFNTLILSCKSCDLTNDAGSSQSGDIKFVWSNGNVELVIFRDENDDASVEFLLINATNVNRDTLKANCIGGNDFKDICQKTHLSGELDHVLQNSAEQIIEGEEILKANFGTVQKGRYHLGEAFPCTADDI